MDLDHEGLQKHQAVLGNAMMMDKTQIQLVDVNTKTPTL